MTPPLARHAKVPARPASSSLVQIESSSSIGRGAFATM
jgi:hypothetical protein